MDYRRSDEDMMSLTLWISDLLMKADLSEGTVSEHILIIAASNQINDFNDCAEEMN